MASVYTIPLLFLNLGGEMLYILDQRLRAQRIPKDRAHKVMNDITGIMLNQRFLAELFKPQEVYNKPALRQLFEDLAHASIMRLNTESMGKLYDLMTMVFKHQVIMCSQPSDIILVTLNHLDAMRDFVTTPLIHKQIDGTYMKIMEIYGKMSSGQLQTLRFSLLNFLQGVNIRVSVFLRENVQTMEGRFIIPLIRTIHPDCEVPGFIRYFDSNGEVNRMERFYPGGSFSLAATKGSMKLVGDRGTKLGCNIYTPSPSSSVCHEENCIHHASHANDPDYLVQAMVQGPRQGSTATADADCSDMFYPGRAELSLLLSQLVGNNSQTATDHGDDENDFIYVNLFKSEEIPVEETPTRRGDEGESDVVTFDARRQGCPGELQKVFGEMTMDAKHFDSKPSEDDDLLDLLCDA